MNLMIVPILVPAIIAALCLFRPIRLSRWARRLSLGSTLVILISALLLFLSARDGTISTYELGDWPAPFGIVMVLDRLSAMMVLLTSLLALAVLGHAVMTGLDRRGWHFHPLFQFQLLGLNGAFLTGDLFNLFVFFEVLLIASYGLMLHGQGAERLHAGVKYVVVNLVGSTLFLIAVGILYGVTGTLNMADMAQRVAEASPGDQPLIRAGAQLLMAVFALKAALLPLHLWLPQTYARTSAPVAALFAILTKVGVYSILRVTILIFGEDAGAVAWAPAGWMLPASILSIAAGFIGVLAARRMRVLSAFAVIGSTGTLLVAVSVFEPAATSAALYYLPHSTLAGAMLFLVTDLIVRGRSEGEDWLRPGAPFAGMAQLSALFLLAAIAMAGLPPLSGFIGKLLILDATAANHAAPWIWGAILGGTFLAILGLARAGSTLFWKSADGEMIPGAKALQPRVFVPAWGLFALLAALTVFAGPASDYAEATVQQIYDRGAYIDAVLGTDRSGS
ncbi:multicomponent K+:H+ antiporter subunit D [Altererythrobacter atlanticus]|uniref:Na(+)/H(+) antiporter subunit D n=1 Tax=Croceibacterium atlanticum TaxID=1267766 RepID=A0A0F7KS55_9SPHN|nr:monovalent cation/H+ antiporter subunit D [Croceibacterium atlanticum]AKH42107.1 Na(+)/H(+) antiporter subunit D [Croceibacterium atlanticum]MBB5733323.1 multicomponent K+:H+ antiporter subunit D [Croceibacterium atlanticum]